MKWIRNNYQIDSEPLMNIPIKAPSKIENNGMIELINQILPITKEAQVKPLEKQIDQLVYKLYDLTPEKIDIVEGFNEAK